MRESRFKGGGQERMWSTGKKTPSSEDRPAFIRTAEAFCAHLESSPNADRATFIRASFLLISRLLAEVMELPSIDGELGADTISDERYNGIVQLMKSKFEEDDYYTTMFDPYEIASEPVVGSVSDDLSDIWRDVKSGLEAIDQGSAEKAIVRWRFTFANHWGDQATQVLRPLRAALLKDEPFRNLLQ